MKEIINASTFRRVTLIVMFSLSWLVWLNLQVHAEEPTVQRPNFLIIVADDMGWSDIGVFGSEIRTPVIDNLAKNGTTMTQFYVAPTCSPTRSMLLTGLDNHLAGVGTMDLLQAPNQLDSVNYAGQLHDGVVTVAEVLQQHDYETYITGKWQLAVDEAQSPHLRGFDRSFILFSGGASHFGDALPLYPGYSSEYFEDGKPVELPDDFYSSISYTDKMIEYIEGRDTHTPFFAYLAYTAPHDPLQVPDDWLDRYKGAYDEGPGKLRETRAQRLREMGLIPDTADLWQAPAYPKWLPLYKPEWSQRSEAERAKDVRPMEIYASMIELLDQQVGRVITCLEKRGELDNTYIIFFSDNGSSAASPLFYPNTTREWFLTERDNRLENMGRPGSHTYLGREWGSATNSPWKLYKATVGDGGIRSPLVVAGPGIPADRMTGHLGHVKDITPTIFSALGIDPKTEPAYTGKELPQGISLLADWEGQEMSSDTPRTFAMELFGNAVVRSGKWKTHYFRKPFGSGEWELYDMDTDPGETVNVAAEHPEMLQELVTYYEKYAKENGIIVPEPPLSVESNRFYTGECGWWCELKFKILDLLIKLR